jgi:hypothetical protein
MAILSMGTALTDEVEAALHLTEIVNPASSDPVVAQNSSEIARIVGAAESFVKVECGRNFEEVTYTDQIYDVAPGTYSLFLTDRPISELTSIAEVTARAADGTVTTTPITPDRYVYNKAAGIVSMLGGTTFASGFQNVRISWKSGYSPAQITGNAAPEIAVLKQLLLSIIAHWYEQHKEGGGGKIQTISTPTGETVTINFNLTQDEQRMINQLRIS